MTSKKSKQSQTGTQTDTLAARTKRNKEKVLEQLEKYPIVQVACERTGIGRSTYYKWRNEDVEFRRVVDAALQNGVGFINDLAESKLIRALQDGHMTAIIYWLKYRHGSYSEKAMHRHVHEIQNSEIDPETIANIKRVMGNAIRKREKNRAAGIGPDHFNPHKQDPLN